MKNRLRRLPHWEALVKAICAIVLGVAMLSLLAGQYSEGLIVWRRAGSHGNITLKDNIIEFYALSITVAGFSLFFIIGGMGVLLFYAIGIWPPKHPK
jgi:hypothetical protein